MKKAKPHAVDIVVNIITGSMLGYIATVIFNVNPPSWVCEILAIASVGLLLQLAAVLKRKKIELLLFATCATTMFIAGIVESNYPITVFIIGSVLTLIICDQILKRVN